MKRTVLLLASAIALLGTVGTGIMTSLSTPTLAARGPQRLSGTLTMFDWGSFTAGPRGKAVIASYERLHPGVKVKLLPLPPGDPSVWEQSVLAAHAAPDILVPPYTQSVFSDLAKNYWLDLTPYLNQPNPYVKGNRHWSDIFDATINQQNSFLGHTYYVISWSAQDVTFFYNKDLFQKAGIHQTPTTWAEWSADAARIQKAGYVGDLYALGDTYPIGVNGSVVSEFENQLMSKTLQRLDTNHDGIVDLKELLYGIKHKIYSPMNADYQEAWKLYKQWSKTWQPDASGTTGNNAPGQTAGDQLFFQGKAAMMYNNTGIAGYLRSLKLKFHWGVFKFPQITPASSPYATAAQKNVGIWGAWNANAFSISAAAKTDGHLALALDFLRWATAPPNDIPAARENGFVPVVKDFQATDPVDAITFDLIRHPSMQFAAEASLGPEWLKERIATQQSYILGSESLSQAMTDMQRYTDQAADRMIKTLHLSV